MPAPASPHPIIAPLHGRAPVVLQVLPALVTGGVERGTVDIALALVNAGWNAIVASAGGRMVHELERAGIVHVPLPLASKNPLVMHQNIRRLADLITRYNVDIVHARSRAPAWSAFYAAKRTNRHFMTTFHNVYGGETAFKRRYNAIMAQGERVIAISQFVGRHAVETYGVAPEKLRVIQRGVDLARFNAAAVHASRIVTLYQAWKLTDGLPVIMLPGRVTRWKGHLELVEAISLLGRNDVQLVFVGNDEQHPDFSKELLRKIEQRGLGGQVHFAGDCKDMAAAYMLADIVVSASIKPEGFGRVAIEAQAMGRLVIATDHGGSQETVIDGETGWLVPPGNARALAEAIGKALSLGAEERARLAAHARSSMAPFDNAIMASSTLAVYDELLFGMPPQADVLHPAGGAEWAGQFAGPAAP